jgi:hypothetical protein
MSAIACELALACAAHPSVDRAACQSRFYELNVRPTTVVSNERHRVRFGATLAGCGHHAAVRGARVHLARYRATTDSRGRATLTVRLASGRYSARLYVHGKAVAHARLTAVPNVSR